MHVHIIELTELALGLYVGVPHISKWLTPYPCVCVCGVSVCACVCVVCVCVLWYIECTLILGENELSFVPTSFENILSLMLRDVCNVAVDVDNFLFPS